MRILHVVESLHVGGLERVVIDLVLQQSASDQQCMVICLFEKGALHNELENANIPVVCCHKKQTLDLSAVRRMAAIINDFGADVVHTHNMSCNYYAALALWKKPEIRLINTRHGIGDMPRKQRWIFGLSLFRTQFLIGVCNQATALLKKRFPMFQRKMKTIPNGIVLERHPPRSEKQHQNLTRSLGWPEDSLMITIVARLNPVKNHKLLLEAFSRLQQDIPLARLVIIGDGKLRTNLEHLAHRLDIMDKVRFLGDRRDVAHLLAGMDLFVLSSIEEGHSISLIEACAAGLPIIATAVGGTPEIVKDNINGLLTESSNTDELAAKMRTLLQNKEKRENFGRNGRIWAEAEGSIQTMANHYQHIYRND